MNTTFKYILPLTIIVLLASCTATMKLRVLHPAAIAIPADLDSIVIVDRTGIERGGGRQLVNVLEGLSSGEPIGGDRQGVKATKMELIKIIQNNDRLSLATHEIPELKIAKLNQVQTPLLKSDVDSICNQYGADGVLSLEFFDSQKIYHYPVNNNAGQNQKSAHVYTQWRLYHYGTSTIIDYKDMTTFGTHYQSFSGIGTGQYKAIQRAGQEAADVYIKRIVPSYYNETRTYFTKGSKQLRMAAKALRVRDLETSKNYYNLMLDTEISQKVIGRAAYNLALVYELEEDFQKALSYAQNASQAGVKSAVRYTRILQTRYNEQPLLQEQLRRE